MASGNLQEWLVVIPDFEDALPKRLQVRPQHLEGLKPRIDSGTWVSGGATLHNPLADGKDKEFSGSYLVARAATKDEVLQEVRRDIYAQSGVWNVDQAQVIPLATAFRTQL